jgi:hypothetical protein
MVDRIEKESAASENLYRGGALECDLCPQMNSCLLMDWQSRWDGGNMGRYAFLIFHRVRLSPWFLDVVADRPAIMVISRLISNHTRVRAHLSRINIVAEALCGCGCDYETVDHILWSCPLYRHERIQLWSQLSTSNRTICVRDILALRQWCDIGVCVSLLSFFFFFFGQHFRSGSAFFGGPSKKIPPKFGEPVRPCLCLCLFYDLCT